MVEKTLLEPVVFRFWKNEIIALFPCEPSDVDGKYCLSYMFMGQHGGANYAMIIQNSRPATPEEYAKLKAELERLGYALRVCQRSSPYHREEFKRRLTI